MNRSMTPEMPINVPSKYILYLAFSSSLSSFSSSKLPNTISQIEKKIKNDINEKGSDEKNGKIKINNKIGGTNAYKQSTNRKYY
jgi:hypothetical protein